MEVLALRYVKIFLSFSIAIWGIVAGIMNLIGYQSGVETVGWVLSLEGSQSIRSISIPILYHLGYAFIYIGKFAAGGVCAYGTVALWKARLASAQEFHVSKYYTIVGCGIALATFFFGFIAVAGTMFDLANNAPSGFALAYHQWATFYITSVGLIAAFIAIKEPNWNS